MKLPVIIVGSSGHAKVIIDIFEKDERYYILGLLDLTKKAGEETLGYKIIGNENTLPELLKSNPGARLFVAIGDNWVRQNVVNKILSVIPNAEFASAIHPSATIGKNVSIGKGTAIMAGAIVNSSSVIGNFAIINTKASLDHDGRMDDFSSLAPGATLGGNVSIGEYTAISIGATVKHGVKIGKHVVVGAGSLLMKDCDDYSIMYGVPAKLMRNRQIGDKYL